MTCSLSPVVKAYGFNLISHSIFIPEEMFDMSFKASCNRTSAVKQWLTNIAFDGFKLENKSERGKIDSTNVKKYVY